MLFSIRFSSSFLQELRKWRHSWASFSQKSFRRVSIALWNNEPSFCTAFLKLISKRQKRWLGVRLAILTSSLRTRMTRFAKDSSWSSTRWVSSTRNLQKDSSKRPSWNKVLQVRKSTSLIESVKLNWEEVRKVMEFQPMKINLLWIKRPTCSTLALLLLPPTKTWLQCREISHKIIISSNSKELMTS